MFRKSEEFAKSLSAVRKIGFAKVENQFGHFSYEMMDAIPGCFLLAEPDLVLSSNIQHVLSGVENTQYLIGLNAKSDLTCVSRRLHQSSDRLRVDGGLSSSTCRLAG